MDIQPAPMKMCSWGTWGPDLEPGPRFREALAEHPKMTDSFLCSAQTLDPLKLAQGCWAGDQSHREGVWTQGPGKKVARKTKGMSWGGSYSSEGLVKESMQMLEGSLCAHGPVPWDEAFLSAADRVSLTDQGTVMEFL